MGFDRDPKTALGVPGMPRLTGASRGGAGGVVHRMRPPPIPVSPAHDKAKGDSLLRNRYDSLEDLDEGIQNISMDSLEGSLGDISPNDSLEDVEALEDEEQNQGDAKGEKFKKVQEIEEQGQCQKEGVKEGQEQVEEVILIDLSCSEHLVLPESRSRGVQRVMNWFSSEICPATQEANNQQDLNDIVAVLDSERDGRIYFGDFCRGVKQITEITSPGTPVTPIGSPQFPLTNHIGSEETLVPVEDDANSSGTHETSELSTYNEYDMMTDDDNATSAPSDSANPSPPHSSDALPTVAHAHGFFQPEDDGDSAISGRSSDPNDNSRREQDVSEEEKFEDFGEADELSETDSHGTPSHAPRVNAGSSRRVTTSALASQLYRGIGSSAGTSRRSSCSDEVFDDIDGNLMELNDKVKRLEGQIGSLSAHQNKTEEKHVRMKEENSVLIERIHTLEEQLRDVEVKAGKTLEEERRKQREVMSRTDKSQEIELLTFSLRHIEREYQVLKEEAPRLRAEVDKLRKDNTHLEEKLNETQYQLLSMAEEHQELQDRARCYNTEMSQERDVHSQLLDELTKELDELRNYKLEMEGRARSHSQSPADIKMAHRRELEMKVVQLKEENARLKEMNDDLHAQLLNTRLEEGRTLLQNGAEASLAAELETLPRDEDDERRHHKHELMQALKEQQDANVKLREYIDRIMLQIIEKDPSILEVNNHKSKQKSNNKKS